MRGWAASDLPIRSTTVQGTQILPNLSDQWFEGYVKPALSASFITRLDQRNLRQAQRRGRTRLQDRFLAEFGEDVSSFGPEDSAESAGVPRRTPTSGESALDFTLGRAQYRLGHGFLVYDGSAEGGSRGGYWTNARKAFEFAAIGRFRKEQHTVEAFYLDKDELRESDSGTRLWGANYELAVGDNSTVGATYMKFSADDAVNPERNG